MLAFTSPTLTEMQDRLTARLAFATREKLDEANSVDVQLHNVMARAESMEYEFDIKRLWLTRSRFNTMARQYVDPVALERCVDLASRLTGPRERGIAVMRYKAVKPRTSGRGTVRRWGACMLAVSFKRVPEPQITLHSRTSYLGYLSALDLGVAHAFARQVGAATNVPVNDMSFVWHLEMAQYHGFKSMAYLLGDPLQRERLEAYRKGDDAPALKITTDWLRRMRKYDEEGLSYSDMTYSTYCRVRRRWHAEVLGVEHAKQFADSETGAFKPLPSVMIDELDLSILRPQDESDESDTLSDVDDDPEDYADAAGGVLV